MQIIEDEMFEMFDSEKILPEIKVKKVITDDGVKIIALEEGDLDESIPIITEVEDLRTLKSENDSWIVGYAPKDYVNVTIGSATDSTYYATGWSI